MSNLEILANTVNEESKLVGKDFSYILDDEEDKLKECFLSLNDSQKQKIIDENEYRTV